MEQQLNKGWLLDRFSSEICIWCGRLLPEKTKKITRTTTLILVTTEYGHYDLELVSFYQLLPSLLESYLSSACHSYVAALITKDKNNSRLHIR